MVKDRRNLLWRRYSFSSLFVVVVTVVIKTELLSIEGEGR
jgi:hypothetical protein